MSKIIEEKRLCVAQLDLIQRMTQFYNLHPCAGNLVLVYPYGSKTLQALADKAMDALEQVVGKNAVRISDIQPDNGFKLSDLDRSYTVGMGSDSKLYFTGVGLKNREYWNITDLATEDCLSKITTETAASGSRKIQAGQL